MKLILAKSVELREFNQYKDIFSLDTIKEAARKALQGIGNKIKNPFKISSTCLYKIYITSTGGAGRAIFLVLIKQDNAVLALLRMKKDKQIGFNMSMSNTKFKNLLGGNLSRIMKDLEIGDFKVFDL